MDTAQLISVFEDYISDKLDSQAILINSGWGTGKTFFWNNTLCDIVKKYHKYPVRISLNGVSSISHVEKKLTKEMIVSYSDAKVPLLKKPLSKIIPGAASILKECANNKIGIDISSLLTEYAGEFCDLSKFVICFDDLERCLLPPKEILGFIGDWIESRKSKVIIIANEDQINKGISDNGLAGYLEIKEKVVSYSFSFKQDITTIFTNLISSFEKDSDVLQERDYLIHLCTIHSILNIRTLLTFLNYAQIVTKLVHKEYKSQIRKILTFLLLLLHEYKQGFLSSENEKEAFELTNIGEIELLNALYSQKDSTPESKQSYGLQFYNKFLSDYSCSFHFYPSLLKFILTGYLDKKLFVQELETLYREESYPPYKSLNHLTRKHFTEFSDQEFSTLTKEVLDYAKEGCYSIYDYYRIGSYFFAYIDHGVISLSKKTIMAKCRKGINEAKKHSIFLEGKLRELRLLGSKRTTQEHEDLYNLVSLADKDLQKKSLIKVRNNFLSKIQNSSTRELGGYLNDVLHVDFLTSINHTKLINIIRNIPNRKIRLIYCFFDERYEIPQNLQNVKQELVWIQRFIELLKKIRHTKNTPIKNYTISYLITTLENILKRDDVKNL